MLYMDFALFFFAESRVFRRELKPRCDHRALEEVPNLSDCNLYQVQVYETDS